MRRILVGTTALVVALAAAVVGAAAPAQASLVGATLVSTPSLTDSNNKEARAECPGDTIVYGGGARISGGAGQVYVRAIIPDASLEFVTVHGEEDGNFPDDWTIVAQAVCGPPGNHGLHVVTVPSVVDGTDISPRSAYAPCPGEVVFSGGFELSPTGGEVFIAEMEPTANLNRVEVQAVEDFNYTTPWDLSAIAICGVPDTSTIALSAPVSTALNSTTNKTVEPRCDPGFTSIGMGGMIHDVNGDGFTNAVLDRFSFNVGLSRVTTTARENGTTTDDWQTLGTVICLS
ncbi:hypothetical protein [Dactylosporangium sp. NPDC000521]|uniref:hypothetical protein n=1 Tax=Dactylosporangium sp. NPDC000521 TaxID=3363975 RepID=UPI00369CF97E